MDSSISSETRPFGVIGSGAFGIALSNLLSENGKVLLYTRRKSTYDQIQEKGFHKNQAVHENIEVTLDKEELCKRCTLVMPAVTSAGFRSMMKDFSPYLRPQHILIHATKGFNINLPQGQSLLEIETLQKDQLRTMTQVMLEECIVPRVGCLSGPNLAKELANKEPAATVIASRFDEVVDIGRAALQSDRFRVYGSRDVLGVELAGVLKNVLAISSGMLTGLGYGDNAKAMLITRGLREMVKIGKMLGSDSDAFFGLAGIGDLIATCSSTLSRNFTVGFRLSSGETLQQIMDDMEEVVEGINTTRIANALSVTYQLDTPIIKVLHAVLFEGKDVRVGLRELMDNDLNRDADYD